MLSIQSSLSPTIQVPSFTGVMGDLLAGYHLDTDTMAAAVGALIDGVWTDAQRAGFLMALAAKGEVTCELVGAALALRERSMDVPHHLPLVMDVCGTGGDCAGAINVSTCVAFVVAACGVPIAKHGNRAASSRCGSADVLEYLGITLDRPPDQAARSLENDHFTFLFAQYYHSAMKAVAPIRRELGVRTVFNVVGPLVNPARATHQIMGVACPQHLELVGSALQALGIEAAAVVHSESGLDEVAGDSPTSVYRFKGDKVLRYKIQPAEYGVYASHASLVGGDIPANAAALVAILGGERSPRTDVVALNAALALQVAGRADSLSDGLTLAREALVSGAARNVFERARQSGHR